MQIIVTPNDIIQRCLWDKYKRLILYDKTEEETKKLVDENKPFSLSEEDAYAIGLLRIIETDNLVHRFNENILDVLQIKSNIIKDELYINKTTIVREISTYMNKFPEYFKPPFNYKQSIEELKLHIERVDKEISKLDIINVKNKDKMFAYFRSKDIRKCLNL
jgi:hypothetical protein